MVCLLHALHLSTSARCWNFTEPDTYCHAKSNSKRNSFGNSHSSAKPNGYTCGDTDTSTDVNADGYTNTDCDADCDCHTQAYAQAASVSRARSGVARTSIGAPRPPCVRRDRFGLLCRCHRKSADPLRLGAALVGLWFRGLNMSIN
jgi:hypothetical protein